jgi:BirA family transcriptional regulator, biotin operon repressor / biotin---[acetyl-CoA-carboxylase] ligase
LSPDQIRRHLDAKWLGRELHCHDRVDSTNLVARELARSGAVHGTVVSAESQSQGRGRLGRGWVSPAHKNLYLSIILRSALPAERLPQIGLLAGVAACDTLREWQPATLKWPNDVLIGGRKVCGILAETEAGAGDRTVVLGIGVNVNAEENDFPGELHDKATSLRLAGGRPVDRARVTGRLLTHLETWYDTWAQRGFAPIAAAWRDRSGLIGQMIHVAEPGKEIAGQVVGLDEDGSLRIRLSSGDEHRVIAGDVTVIGGYQRKADS